MFPTLWCYIVRAWIIFMSVHVFVYVWDSVYVNIRVPISQCVKVHKYLDSRTRSTSQITWTSWNSKEGDMFTFFYDWPLVIWKLYQYTHDSNIVISVIQGVVKIYLTLPLSFIIKCPSTTLYCYGPRFLRQ